MRALRMLAVVVLVVAAPSLWVSAAWAGYDPAPRGFDASLFAEFDGAICGGAGPTGLGAAQGKMWAAADGQLYVRDYKSTAAQPVGSIEPWGLVPFQAGVYATQPGCDTSTPTSAPDPGLLGTPCNVVRTDASGNETAVIADVCGTAITLQPGTNRPTVATRDGRIVVIDPSDGTVQTLVDGLGGDPALHLAWRGSTLYYARVSGGIWRAGRGLVADIADVVGLIAPDGFGLDGRLVATRRDGAMVALDPTGADGPDVFGHADDFGGVLAAGDVIGILVGHTGTVWQLDGTYEPPAPPPPPPTEAASPPPPEPPPAAAPPPPATAPPPPPPAPAAAAPAAPSSVTQVVTAPGSTSVATSAVPGTATAQAPAIGLVPDDVEGEPQLALEGNRRRDPAAPLLFVPAAGILLAGAALQLHREQTHAAVARAADVHLVRERFGRAKRSRRSSRAW
jgi:hypothetical protein